MHEVTLMRVYWTLPELRVSVSALGWEGPLGSQQEPCVCVLQQHPLSEPG